jgi:hypothetical protein
MACARMLVSHAIVYFTCYFVTWQSLLAVKIKYVGACMLLLCMSLKIVKIGHHMTGHAHLHKPIVNLSDDHDTTGQPALASIGYYDTSENQVPAATVQQRFGW